MIVSFGVFLSLLELIHDSVKSFSLVEKAIGFLENIFYSSESALCEVTSTGGAIQILFEAIEDESYITRQSVFSGYTSNMSKLQRKIQI